MTAANWITLIVPILGLLGGGLIYVLQKYIDRENEVRRERRLLYRNAAILLERVNQRLRTNEPDKALQLEAISDLEVTIAEIQVACPDTVADVWADIPSLVSGLQIEQHRLSSEKGYGTFSDAIRAYEKGRARALQAMRKDTYGETRITLEKIAASMSEMATAQKRITDFFL